MNLASINPDSKPFPLRYQASWDSPFLLSDILLHISEQFEVACVLTSSGFQNDNYSSYDIVAAFGAEEQITCENHYDAFSKLELFCKQNKGWKFGFFSYDLKNDTENLFSNQADSLKMPELFFFVPQILICLKNNQLSVYSYNNCTSIIETITSKTIPEPKAYICSKPNVQQRISKAEYIANIEKLKQHIQRGDVYEINFCMEFFCENISLDPAGLFKSLNRYSSAPFSAFFKIPERTVICSSPERFLKKTGNRLISQPIKGTVKRSICPTEDTALKEQLYSSSKNRSENVMIVDLVRNDLSMVAQRASVQVDELFGIYTFPHVHHLISTISCKLNENIHPVQAIKKAFPMGSMTGAPKIKAMSLIESYEKSKRGLFSGSIGYFTPENNFDFNVVIRTMLYNAKENYLSFTAGGAITAESDPIDEYEECLLKAKALTTILTEIYENQEKAKKY